MIAYHILGHFPMVIEKLESSLSTSVWSLQLHIGSSITFEIPDFPTIYSDKFNADYVFRAQKLWAIIKIKNNMLISNLVFQEDFD